jgi:hypothetical protein
MTSASRSKGEDGPRWVAKYDGLEATWEPAWQPRRSFWHWLRGCRGGVVSDHNGLWFQCAHCDRVSGFVRRRTLDRIRVDSHRHLTDQEGQNR